MHSFLFFFFSSRRRHTRCYRDWSSDVCSSDLKPDGIAKVSNPVCGDVMKLWVKVDNGFIRDARFKAQGCSAAIATSSYATQMLIGMNVADARLITKEQIAEALGGLPASKIHCSVL